MRRKNISLLIALTLPSLALSLSTEAKATETQRDKPAAQVTTTTSSRPQQEKPKQSPPTSYTVRSGDTLSAIADKQDQRYSDLLGRNRQFWANPDLIHPGNKVRLTGKVHTPPAPRSASAAESQPLQKSYPTKKRSAPSRSSSPAPATGSPKAYAQSVLGPAQYSCLNSLFNRESGWNVYATNPSSGAYGIPQALPGHKMASAGSDWRTNGVTQVKWGISYANNRYGSACGAWNHFLRNNWY